MEKDVKIMFNEAFRRAMDDIGFAQELKIKLNGYAKYENEELMKFLKQQGFRPKSTASYLERLNKRLKSKNLELIVKRNEKGVDYPDGYRIEIDTTFAFVPIVESQGESIKIPKLKLIEPNIDLEDAKAYSSPSEWHHDSLVYSGILGRKTELVTIPRTMLDEMIALLQTHGKGTKQKVLAMLKEVAR